MQTENDGIDVEDDDEFVLLGDECEDTQREDESIGQTNTHLTNSDDPALHSTVFSETIPHIGKVTETQMGPAIADLALALFMISLQRDFYNSVKERPRKLGMVDGG